MKKLLIVEDDVSYLDIISQELIDAGYDVDKVTNPVKGLELVALNKYDVVLSDLNLPVMSGVTFTESVKNISPSTACIIITGDPDEISEVQSIQKNIDLYIEKNKSMKVLINYIEKLSVKKKKEEVSEKSIVSNGENIVMELMEHRVYKDEKHIELTPKEFEILKLLLLNKNNVLSRDYLIEEVWEEPAEDVDIRLVDSHIRNLREKLNSVSLMTVRGYGYRWNEVE